MGATLASGISIAGPLVCLALSTIAGSVAAEEGAGTTTDRNGAMIARIERAAVRYPFSFVFAGDSGFTPNPAGDAVFQRILGRIGQLQPKPLFFVNLGDFAGQVFRVSQERIEPDPDYDF